jgi:hypothetical protein
MSQAHVTGPIHAFIARVDTTVAVVTSSRLIGRTEVVEDEEPEGLDAAPTPSKADPEPPPTPPALDRGLDLPGVIQLNIEKSRAEPEQPDVEPDPREADADVQGMTPYRETPPFEEVQPLDFGPADRYETRTPVGFTTGRVFYLGTCEVTPQIEFRPYYKQIFLNEVGHAIPWDKAYEGRDAVVSMTLTAWNEWAYALAVARTNARAGGGPPGVDRADAYGSLVGAEGLTWMLLLQFPFSGKPVFARAGMPPGYRFFACTPLNEGKAGGLRPGELRMSWHAQRWHDFATGDTFLFDHDMSGAFQLQ